MASADVSTIEDALEQAKATSLAQLSGLIQPELAKIILLSEPLSSAKPGHWKKLQLAARASWDCHTIHQLQQRMNDSSTFSPDELLSSAQQEPDQPKTAPSQLLLLGQTQILLGSTEQMIAIILQFLNELAAPDQGSINMLRGMRTYTCAGFLMTKDYEYVRQLELVATQLQFVDQLEIAPGHLRKIVIACQCALQQQAYKLA
eukprot:TRINITY_DN1242_c0_g1_i1.p1 TRINITY_DN1242_c0_g1~~TRINITY_DN1242_c0_g1_i1.p1  ORF type:complete len:203 (+),score=36.68 TRINITY_DN1242_c0_g1_i1:83-691(+)